MYSRLKGYLRAFVFMGQEAKIPDGPVHYQSLATLSDLPTVPRRETDRGMATGSGF